MLHQTNEQPPRKCVTVQRPESFTKWEGFDYRGGSVCAFDCLAKKNDYTMVYCESKGLKCFWIENSLIRAHLRVNTNLVQKILSPEFLYRNSAARYPEHDKAKIDWLEVNC